MISRKNTPEKFWVDEGTEYGGTFQSFCKEKYNEVYSTMNETKVALAERFSYFKLYFNNTMAYNADGLHPPKAQRSNSLYGGLAILLFSCEKLVLANTKVQIKPIGVRPNFYMLSDNQNDSLKTFDCSLLTRRTSVPEPNHQYLQSNLKKESAEYNYIETIA